MPRIRILSRAEIARMITMGEAIELMRDAFIALSDGCVDVPVRMNMSLGEHSGRALFMPVYSPDLGQIGLKAVTVNPENAKRNLPFIHALVIVTDATTGAPLAVMDGEHITALRTGAGTGVATDLLARPEACVVAIFGAGVQARTQLEAVCAVRDVDRVLVFGRSMTNAELFAVEAATKHKVNVSIADRPEALLAADIICTATTSLTPVFDPQHVKLGCHINGVGSYRPDMTEIPAETVAGAKVIVDQRKACLAEAGDLLVPLEAGHIGEGHIHAELGEIAGGSKEGRESASEITFFKSVGNAAQDLAVASHLTRVAQELGLGNEVVL